MRNSSARSLAFALSLFIAAFASRAAGAAPRDPASELRECTERRISLEKQLEGFKADAVVLRRQMADLRTDLFQTAGPDTKSAPPISVEMQADAKEIEIGLQVEIAEFENVFRKEIHGLRGQNEKLLSELKLARASIDEMNQKLGVMGEKTQELRESFDQDLRTKSADVERLNRRNQFLESELRRGSSEIQSVSKAVSKFDATRIDCPSKRCGDTLSLSGKEKKVISGFHLTVAEMLEKLSLRLSNSSEETPP